MSVSWGSGYCIKATRITIADGCFSGCLSLQNLFGFKVRDVADTAFYSCSMLASVTFLDPKTLGNACFEKSGITSADLSQAGSLNLTNAIYAFCDCTFLENITLHTSRTITEFPEAFCRGCESLTKIDATTALTKISKDAFSGCSSFEPKFTYGTVELRDNCFSGCKFTVADFRKVTIKSERENRAVITNEECSSLAQLDASGGGARLHRVCGVRAGQLQLVLLPLLQYK